MTREGVRVDAIVQMTPAKNKPRPPVTLFLSGPLGAKRSLMSIKYYQLSAVCGQLRNCALPPLLGVDAGVDCFCALMGRRARAMPRLGDAIRCMRRRAPSDTQSRMRPTCPGFVIP